MEPQAYRTGVYSCNAPLPRSIYPETFSNARLGQGHRPSPARAAPIPIQPTPQLVDTDSMSSGGKPPAIGRQLRELPFRYKLWHSVPLLMPVGLLLVLLGSGGTRAAGFLVLAIVVIDLAVVFPLVSARARARRARKD